MTAPRILVIGSDESTGASVGDVLQRDYFDVRRMPGFFSEHELSSQLQGSDRPALVVEGSGQWTRVFPALDCEETDRELVDRGARVPLLIVSAAITSREKARALDAGVEDVLSRPYGEEELVSRVKAILRRVRPHRGMEVITYKNISLDHVCLELNIPKETIRRKVNELQESGILTREGKSIVFNKRGMNYQKPESTIEILSKFIEKKSNLLQGNSWFGETLNQKQIKEFINKYFTVVWLRFFKLQIPFLIRHRNVFQDLETWVVWGNIALNQQDQMRKARDRDLLFENARRDNYYNNMANSKIARGINASSIADISQIPRATVIRKLKWLIKQDIIKKSKNLEYQLKNSGKINKVVAKNTIINQEAVADFLTDIFDYMKNSNFKL